MLTIREAQMQQLAASTPGKNAVFKCQQLTWIEFQLVDADDKPVPGQPYKVKLPDGSITEGALDHNGKVRFDGIIPGTASICFPAMDTKEWWRH